MNIAVYLASNEPKNPHFSEGAKALGKWIGENGHTLIYGGSDVGMMGDVANATLDNGGKAVGVVPNVPAIRAVTHKKLTATILVDGMAERKDAMNSTADAFVTLPGAPGTLDELSELIAMAKLGMMPKPCVIFNIDGFYDPLIQLLENMYEENLMTRGKLPNVIFASTLDEVIMALTGKKKRVINAESRVKKKEEN